jgi:hypothetical protein
MNFVDDEFTIIASIAFLTKEHGEHCRSAASSGDDLPLWYSPEMDMP